MEKPSGQTGGQTVGQTRKSRFFVPFLVPLEPIFGNQTGQTVGQTPKNAIF